MITWLLNGFWLQELSKMKRLKVLNLYAGIGGNRKLWSESIKIGGITYKIEVTGIENNPEIAKIYQDFFPRDKVIVTDAHQYLLDHYKEYDFIWSSPPCPTHSVTNFFLNAQGVIRYPNMNLWQEIIFLKHFCYSKWVVENVVSYYKPLIKPFHLERHYFWSNFIISNKPKKNDFNIINARESTRVLADANIKHLEKLHNFDLSKYKKVKDIRKLLRNCVNPKLGLHIFNEAFKVKQTTL